MRGSRCRLRIRRRIIAAATLATPTRGGFMRTPLYRLALGLVALAASAAATAQSYPSRPVTMIVPYAAGGNVDAVARWVAPELTKRLGQQVIVENIAGAGGVIGTE